MKPETVFLGEMTSPEVEAFLKTHHTVIVPVGAVEQHGPHLALLTDVLIPQEVARRAAATLGGQTSSTLVAASAAAIASGERPAPASRTTRPSPRATSTRRATAGASQTASAPGVPGPRSSIEPDA